MIPPPPFFGRTSPPIPSSKEHSPGRGEAFRRVALVKFIDSIVISFTVSGKGPRRREGGTFRAVTISKAPPKGEETMNRRDPTSNLVAKIVRTRI